jgi:peptidoglycan hydrolase-like protein with peptidoglycan-binding domain
MKSAKLVRLNKITVAAGCLLIGGGSLLSSCSSDKKSAATVVTTAAPTTLVAIEANNTWPVLAAGAKGDQVLVLQHLLASNGLKLKTDGVFGGETKAALKKFQTTKQLEVSETVTTTQTWQTLAIDVTKESPAEAIKAMQVALGLKGTKLEVTGIYDQPTIDAIEQLRTTTASNTQGPFTVYDWLLLIGKPETSDPTAIATGTDPAASTTIKP